jgi:hypothetical protein
MARRRTEVFTLSFLDCICCGFGAVVLFYTIISAHSGVNRVRKNEHLTAEVNRIEEQVLTGTRNLVVLRNTLEQTEINLKHAAARSSAIVAELGAKREVTAQDDTTSVARREHIEKLKADIRALQEGNERLEAAAIDRAPPGEKVKAFRGTGDRRYITGLKLKGKHILVLLDRSASMVDDDLVNIIKLRNSTDLARRATRKWHRAIDTVDWLATQLPAGSKFQIYGFNIHAEPLIGTSAGQWIDSGDATALGAASDALHAMVPRDGTSFVNAFAAIKSLSPAPDQVVLITDGLPTQGVNPPVIRKYIDASGRAKLFDDAVKTVPHNMMVDVVLLPMQGDVPAGYRFWKLARDTGGAFLMPAKDWP